MQETLDYVFKEISSLWAAFGKLPIFGVECEVRDPDRDLAAIASMRIRSE